MRHRRPPLLLQLARWWWNTWIKPLWDNRIKPLLEGLHDAA